METMYIHTYNEINSTIYKTKEEAIKAHQDYIKFFMDDEDFVEHYILSDSNRECDAFGTWSAYMKDNVMSMVSSVWTTARVMKYPPTYTE